MSEIRIVRDYPYPVITVWRALTDPALVPLWTATGQGGRPEGFSPVPGTRFRFMAKPVPGLERHRQLRGPRGRGADAAALRLARRRRRPPTVVTYTSSNPRRHPLHLGAHRVHRRRRPVHVPAARAASAARCSARDCPRPGRHRRRRPSPRQHAAGQARAGRTSAITAGLLDGAGGDAGDDEPVERDRDDARDGGGDARRRP